jgi:hypothetical protein
LSSGDPQYAHFGGPLHVKVETTAPPATAYSRVAGVLEILSKLLQPVCFFEFKKCIKNGKNTFL